MRDLLYKNLTSSARGRKIISSCEVTDQEGIHSVVRRHFACIIKQLQSADQAKPQPYLFVLKETNTKQRREHFFCKVRGSLLAANKDKLLLVSFVHTLNIELTASEGLTKQIS